MEYEKEYKAALERARAGKPLDEVFPELKESEDDRIRKEIIRFLYAWRGDSKVDKWLAYLEKQKEPRDYRKLYEEVVKSDWFKENYVGKSLGEDQQPAEWSEEDEQWLESIIKDYEQKEQKPNVELIQKSWYMEGYHDGKYNNEPKWLIQTGKGGPMYEENPKYGTQKPAEWSEEDETLMDELESYILFDKEFSEEQKKWRLDKLKSLRPQPHWKPSEEEIGALERAIIKMHTPTDIDILAELRDNLKKL